MCCYGDKMCCHGDGNLLEGLNYPNMCKIISSSKKTIHTYASWPMFVKNVRNDEKYFGCYGKRVLLRIFFLNICIISC